MLDNVFFGFIYWTLYCRNVCIYIVIIWFMTNTIFPFIERQNIELKMFLLDLSTILDFCLRYIFLKLPWNFLTYFFALCRHCFIGYLVTTTLYIQIRWLPKLQGQYFTSISNSSANNFFLPLVVFWSKHQWLNLLRHVVKDSRGRYCMGCARLDSQLGLSSNASARETQTWSRAYLDDSFCMCTPERLWLLKCGFKKRGRVAYHAILVGQQA